MRNLLLVAALLGSPGALAAPGAFEIGAQAGYIGFDGLNLPETSWYVSPRLGYWFNRNVALELDVGVSAGNAAVTDHKFLAITPLLNFVGSPIPDAAIQPILTVGVGSMIKQVDGAGVRGESFAHQRIEAVGSMGTGAIIPIVGPLVGRIDARFLVSAAPDDDNYSGPFMDFNVTAGLAVIIGGAKDTDKDKIVDDKDMCPNDPEDMDDFEDEDGCPELDNDNDGVPDLVDTCRNEAEDIDAFEDADGCPDLDNDADGTLDVDDACPIESGPAATGGCPDKDGDGFADKDDRCPEIAGEFGGCPDTDGDSLIDIEDECPNDAGPVESFGCPDNDSDKVPNYRDKCPDKAAQEGIDPMRSDGCPKRVYVSLDSIQIEEQVHFASGKAIIRSVSYSLLREIAAVFKKHTSIKKVLIEGHTDSQGAEAANLTLSDNRANAVMNFLIKEGVGAERLEALGHGESKPIADNGTSAGRAENRRVELKITEQTRQTIIKDVTDVEAGDKVEGEVEE